MESESARVTTSEEAAFRVPYPNSTERKSLVVVLDETSRHIFDAAADLPWNGARFFSFEKTEPVSSAIGAMVGDVILKELNGGEVRLSEEIAGTDVVVMITSAGESAEAAAGIGKICFAHNVMTTGLILSGDKELEASTTLQNLRPYAAMLVVATGEDYIPAMLAALRA